jgi:hypothetical protein
MVIDHLLHINSLLTSCIGLLLLMLCRQLFDCQATIMLSLVCQERLVANPALLHNVKQWNDSLEQRVIMA